MVNSQGKLLKLALTLTRLSVQSRPQLLLKLSSQLSAAKCTIKQVLRFWVVALQYYHLLASYGNDKLCFFFQRLEWEVKMADAQFLRKPGSTLCICGTSYKNNAVPPSCTSEGCGYQLGKKLREGVKITCRNLPNCLKEGFEKSKKRNFPQ